MVTTASIDEPMYLALLMQICSNGW